MILKVRLPQLSDVVGKGRHLCRPISVAVLVQPMLDDDGVAFLRPPVTYTAEATAPDRRRGRSRRACSLFNRRLVDSILFVDADNTILRQTDQRSREVERSSGSEYYSEASNAGRLATLPWLRLSRRTNGGKAAYRNQTETRQL